jgi:hypothetical protein
MLLTRRDSRVGRRGTNRSSPTVIATLGSVDHGATAPCCDHRSAGTSPPYVQADNWCTIKVKFLDGAGFCQPSRQLSIIPRI